MEFKHNRHTAVMHVSATVEQSGYTFEKCRDYHMRVKGWSDIGYHFFIGEDASLHIGRPLNRNGAHVRGHNTGTIGICVAGGLDKNRAPKDTMTEQQQLVVEGLLLALKEGNPKMKVKGHRDYSEDLNGNGIIEPFEFMKACPCYDAQVRFGIFNSTLKNVLVRMGR
jgi:hypothetical protein